MKILIPVIRDEGMDSKVNPHFGQSQTFALYDKGKKELQFFRNECAHAGGCMVVDEMLKHAPDMVYALDMGFKATEKFKMKDVKVKTGEFRTVKKVIENVEKLSDLTDTCIHQH